MKHVCPLCHNDFTPDSVRMLFKCKQCDYMITMQLVEHLDPWQLDAYIKKCYGSVEPAPINNDTSFGLFQIHESPLVPQNTAYIVNTNDSLKEWFKEQMKKQLLEMSNISWLISNPKIEPKPFDYRERAAVEFDIDDSSGLR